MQRSLKVSLGFLAIVFLLCLGGCDNRLTLDNYNKLQVGMSVDQVTSILGPGEKQTKGAGTKLAQDFLGDITSAQAQQNQRNIKQGLGDLTGQIQARDQQTQNEAEGKSGPSSRVPNPKEPRGPQGVSAQPGPVWERWIWSDGKVEISVEFLDDKLSAKNQDGL